MKSKNLFFGIFLFLIIFSFSLVVISYQNELERVEDFNKYYNKGVIAFNNGEFEYSDAEYNYDLWSSYYDEGYLEDSIEYCVGARDLYSSANSYNQNAIANFEEADKLADEDYKDLINYQIKALKQSIEINWAMYEACEYFESASNAYSKELFETGDSELAIGNEKIVLHDSLVVDYNYYISKIEVLQENI